MRVATSKKWYEEGKGIIAFTGAIGREVEKSIMVMNEYARVSNILSNYSNRVDFVKVHFIFIIRQLCCKSIGSPPHS